jgi:hypothetical protein
VEVQYITFERKSSNLDDLIICFFNLSLGGYGGFYNSDGYGGNYNSQGVDWWGN